MAPTSQNAMGVYQKRHRGTENGTSVLRSGVMAQITDDDLIWNGNNVAQLMWQNDIRSRAALAEHLSMPRSMINRAFDEDWQGRATPRLIVRLAVAFHVAIAHIVVEPVLRARRMKDPEISKPVNGAAMPQRYLSGHR